MPYTVKTKLGPIRTIYDIYGYEKNSLDVYTGYSASYSYRTGKDPGLLQLGEPRLQANSSIADCLAAERAAIRELDAEAGVDSLGCGAYSSDDAGHSFSRIKLRTGIRHVVGSGYGRTLDYIRAYDVPLVDPLTSAIWAHPIQDLPVCCSGLISDVGSGGRHADEASVLASLLNDASHTLVSMYPDKIKGTLGQDLVDLAQLPKLVKRLADTRRLMGDLQRKWMRLSQSVRDIIDSDIKHALLKSSKKATHAASSAALEWMFVLKPYIEDIKTVMSFLAKAEGSCVQRSRRVRTSHAYTTDFEASAMAPAKLEDFDPATSTFYNETALDYHCRYDYRVTAAFRRRKPVISPWLEKAEAMNQQLGIWYPSLLWDLMPWSFVIDWITNIGDVIDAASEYEAKYHISYSYITVKGATMGFFPPLPPSGWHYTSTEVITPFLEFLTRAPLDPSRGLRPHLSRLSSEEKGILALLGLSR